MSADRGSAHPQRDVAGLAWGKHVGGTRDKFGPRVDGKHATEDRDGTARTAGLGDEINTCRLRVVELDIRQRGEVGIGDRDSHDREATNLDRRRTERISNRRRDLRKSLSSEGRRNEGRRDRGQHRGTARHPIDQRLANQQFSCHGRDRLPQPQTASIAVKTLPRPHAPPRADCENGPPLSLDPTSLVRQWQWTIARCHRACSQPCVAIAPHKGRSSANPTQFMGYWRVNLLITPASPPRAWRAAPAARWR